MVSSNRSRGAPMVTRSRCSSLVGQEARKHEPKVWVRDVSLSYPAGKGDSLLALDGIDLKVRPGSFSASLARRAAASQRCCTSSPDCTSDVGQRDGRR